MSRVQANRRETEPPVRGNPLDGLHGFLAEYPTLGLEHPLGRAIHEQVKQTRPVTLGPSVWFRGLACSASSAPRANDFLPPDPHRIAVPEQRFNHQGQRVFYLSDSARGAALECREEDEREIWVQSFRAGVLGHILDLASAGGDRNGVVVEAATYSGDAEDGIKRPLHLQPQYLVPRFLADCARSAGVAGLLVPSVEEGTNLVLFRWDDRQVRAEGEPEMFEFGGS
jgi:RES domain-containing protein